MTAPPPPEPRAPRGCNPLVFGLVAATVEIAVIAWLVLR